MKRRQKLRHTHKLLPLYFMSNMNECINFFIDVCVNYYENISTFGYCVHT